MLIRAQRWPLRAWVKVIIVAVVLMGVAYALARSWAELDSSAWNLRPQPAIGTFLLWLLATVWVAPLWVTICRGLGGSIRMRQGMRIHLMSNLGKYLPGKVLHAVGLVVMARDLGVPGTIGVTSVLVELALSLTGAGLVSLLGLPLLLEQQRAILIPLASAGLLGALLVMHPAVLGRLLRLGSRFVPGAAGQFDDHQLLSYRKTLGLLCMYAVSWLILGLSLFQAAQIVYPIEPSALVQMAGIMALSYLFGLAVPFAPAGLGAREGATALLLSTMMPLPAAVTISVLARLIGIAAEAFGALVASRL